MLYVMNAYSEYVVVDRSKNGASVVKVTAVGSE